MDIKTNHVPRLVVDSYDLEPAVREKFDYYDDDAISSGVGPFVKYKGEWYDLSEFAIVPALDAGLFDAWDGMATDTFFSATLIKWTDEDHVVMGRCYS